MATVHHRVRRMKTYNPNKSDAWDKVHVLYFHCQSVSGYIQKQKAKNILMCLLRISFHVFRVWFP